MLSGPARAHNFGAAVFGAPLIASSYRLSFVNEARLPQALPVRSATLGHGRPPHWTSPPVGGQAW